MTVHVVSLTVSRTTCDAMNCGAYVEVPAGHEVPLPWLSVTWKTRGRPTILQDYCPMHGASCYDDYLRMMAATGDELPRPRTNARLSESVPT